jgi:molecular chaperone Hsp33
MASEPFGALLSMGGTEIKKLIEENEPTEVCCHFCRSAYCFSPEELGKLLDSAEN